MIVFLSNGAGEDAIAARLAAHLRQLRPEWEQAAFPLIGSGSAYPDWMTRLGTGQAPPSGGLSNESWRLLWRDLRSGWLAVLQRQLSALRSVRARRLVAVGDLVPVLFGALARQRRLLFVGTAKSVHHHAYSWPERLLLRRFADMTLARDEPTAERLRSHGLPARWVGNAMMDELQTTGRDLPEGALALFPGSREAAYGELPRLLRIVEQLGRPGLVALAPSLDLERLAAPGWARQGEEMHKDGAPPVRLLRGALGDVLAHSLVAVGQAGTANEQAAGAGVPVVAIHERGALGWYRGRQKGLLGEALEVVPDEQAAVSAVRRLLADEPERARRAAVGRERMGPAGGAARMAAWIADHS